MSQVKVLKKQYFGPASNISTSMDSNPFDDLPKTGNSIAYISSCTNKNCDKVEIMSSNGDIAAFPRCTVCFTRYCSRNCQVEDHKHGDHKTKCARFLSVKEKFEKVLCKQCWKSKWNVVSDFYSNGILSCKEYSPCGKCQDKEIYIEDKLDDDTSSDPDIRRVWLY
jgi:hypothetical protein